jgi:alanine dehydrogenase
MVATLVAAALIFGPTFAWAESSGGDLPWFVGGVLGFYVLNVISAFFGVAFIGVARRSIAGEPWSMGDGWSAAAWRLGPILWWAAVSTVVGLILQALERVRGGVVINVVARWIVGAAWSLATFFIVPVLAVEGGSPFAAAKRSAQIVRKRWGEGIVGATAIGGLFTIAICVAVIPIVLGLASITSSPFVGLLLVVVGVVAAAIAIVANSAASQLFRFVLYEYAATDNVVGGSHRRSSTARSRSAAASFADAVFGGRCRLPPAMRIGVAKEIKQDEYRVALTPAGALELTRQGHEVVIETGAGLGSAMPDRDYERVGARIGSVEEVWESSDLVLKVKEPIEPEYSRLREGLILFTYLHIAADEPLTRALLDSGITAVAYETVEVGRTLPLLAPMSEVAGRLASQAGAYFLEKPLGGRGLLLGGVPGVAPGRVVIVGGGVVGYNAAVIALGLGAQVTILERSIDRMRHLEEVLSGRVTLLMSSSLQIEASVTDADLVIGAVLIPGAVAPKLVTREMIGEMKDGAVVVDVAIDQGGCFETSHATTHADPVYVVDGVTHYCVANMPGAVPITSTKSLTNATLPYVEAIANRGLRDAVANDPALAKGVNVVDGKLTYEAVAEAHGLDYTPLEGVLPLSAV